MTRARTASYGVVTPPPLDRWIDAVLMLCVSLVQGATTTLRMWLSIEPRDWHTQSETCDLPRATSGIQLRKETHSTLGVILGLAPTISVADAPSGMEADKVRVPGEGRGPVLRTAQTATDFAKSAYTRHEYRAWHEIASA